MVHVAVWSCGPLPLVQCFNRSNVVACKQINSLRLRESQSLAIVQQSKAYIPGDALSAMLLVSTLWMQHVWWGAARWQGDEVPGFGCL